MTVRLGGRAVRINYSAVQTVVGDYHTAGSTYSQIAVRCKVSPRTLRRFLAGASVSGRSLDNILSGLSLKAADIVRYIPEGRA